MEGGKRAVQGRARGNRRRSSHAHGRLQAEIKKRHAFESAEQEALLNLLRTSDRFQTSMTRLFRKYGLTPSQYNVLRILRGEGKPLPCLEIADRLIAEVPGITGLLDRLEAAGLIRRERSKEDRRSRLRRDHAPGPGIARAA